MAIDQHDPIYNQAKQLLLTSFNMCAPTGVEQRAMVTRLNDAERDGASLKEQVYVIADALANGLKFNRWPT